MIKDAIEARLSAIAELAPLMKSAGKLPRLTATFKDGKVRVDITAPGPRGEARRLIHIARAALHGQALDAGGRKATPRHIATDYHPGEACYRAEASFAVRIEPGASAKPAKPAAPAKLAAPDEDDAGAR